MKEREIVSRDMGRAELERLIAGETEASERTRDEPLPGRAARKRPPGRWCTRSG